MSIWRSLEGFWQDFKFGGRLLARSPLFSLVAIGSLALGIGANSAIFSLINAIVLRTLPVAQPEQLYIAEVSQLGQLTTRVSWPAYEGLRTMIGSRAELSAASSLASMQVAAQAAIASPGSASSNAIGGTSAIGGGAGAGRTALPQAALVQLVDGSYFSVLRQRAQRGRLLSAEDNRRLGDHPVAVITDGYWSRTFGRAETALGSELIVNGQSMTIVGITEPGFEGTIVGTRNVDLWAPLMMQAALRYAGNASNSNGDDTKPWVPQREISWLQIVLRTQPSQVAAIADALTIGLRRELTQVAGYNDDADFRRYLSQAKVQLTSGARGLSRIRDEMTTPLIALLVMVGLLLAIACANIASLLLARASNRQREMAIRLSAGAGRGRLMRQLLTESLLLALIGGGAGLLVAEWTSAALVTYGMSSSGSRGAAPIPGVGIDLSPDWRVIAFTLGVSVITGLLFGLLPALRSTRVSLAETLKSQTRSVMGAGSRTLLSRVLIGAQMALSLLLLIVAGLFARSLQQLTRVDVGFDRDHLLIARIDPRAGGYGADELPGLYTRLHDRLSAMPGVTSVSLSLSGPFAGSRRMSGFEAEGYTRGRDERLLLNEDYVTPDYFRTTGLTIVEGRAFTTADLATTRRVSIINETMAKQYFKGGSPIGKRWSYDTEFDEESFEIVGVVQDARYDDLKDDSRLMAYRPVAQSHEYLASVELRTAGTPAALAGALRAALREGEPRLPLISVETLDERVVRALGPEKMLASLTLAFGAVALFLACLGLYGTISYAVTRRTSELGVRMALGANRGAVQWLIMREALALVFGGLLVGIPLAFVAAQAMARLFYGVDATDPLAHSGAIAMLVVVAALAAYLPARRASRVDPMLALRAD